MDKELIEKLEKMPIEKLKELSSVRTRKNEMIRLQKYEVAVNLRGQERRILEEFGIPTDLKMESDIISFLRNRKLDNLLNEDI